jgi:hypothetical protein
MFSVFMYGMLTWLDTAESERCELYFTNSSNLTQAERRIRESERSLAPF